MRYISINDFFVLNYIDSGLLLVENTKTKIKAQQTHLYMYGVLLVSEHFFKIWFIQARSTELNLVPDLKVEKLWPTKDGRPSIRVIAGLLLLKGGFCMTQAGTWTWVFAPLHCLRCLREIGRRQVVACRNQFVGARCFLSALGRKSTSLLEAVPNVSWCFLQRKNPPQTPISTEVEDPHFILFGCSRATRQSGQRHVRGPQPRLIEVCRL